MTTVRPQDLQQARPTTQASTASRRSPLALALAMIGAGAIAVALLGPLGTGTIQYHASAGAVDQVRGGDIAGLLLVGPVSMAAAWLVLRRRPGAEALALAPASYGLYLYTQLAISGDLAQYGGNSERWFVLFWALIMLCGGVLVVAGHRLFRAAAPGPRPRLQRVTGWYLLGVAVFLTVGLHLPGLADAWRATPTRQEYLDDPVVFWVVKVMDLAYVVPIVLAIGIGLLRNRQWARRLLAPVVGWSALLGCSVAGMGLAMLTSDAPGASVALASGFVLAAALALALAVMAYRPILQAPPHAVAPPAQPPTGSSPST
jgi:hypothetical protein